MSWSLKPATGTGVRNPWCPLRNDLLKVGLPIDDGSGTTVRNLGKAQDAPFGATMALTNTPTWGTGAYGDKLTFNGTNQDVTIVAASGADLTFPRGTMMIWLEQTSTIGVKTWIGGSTTTSGNRIRVLQISSTNSLQVFHYFSGTNSRIDFALNEATFGVALLFVSWGEQGFSARLFGSSGEVAWSVGSGTPSSDIAAMVIPDGDTFKLMSAGGSVGTFPAGDLYGFGWWDWQLSERQIEQIAADPAIWSRPMQSALTDLNNPMIGRVTGSTAYIGGMVTADDLSGTCYFRVVAAATLDGMITAPDTVVDVDSASQAATLGALVSDLGGARYWQARVSSDGTNYYPLPGGMGFFNTFPAAGTPYDFVHTTDSHFGSNTTNEHDWSDGYFTDATGVNLRYSYMIEDIFERTPMFTLFGGDEYFFNGPDAAYEAIVRWRNYINPITQSCCCFFMLGNHEREGGYCQQAASSSTVPNQRESTILRKKFWVNPKNDTYPLGGENDTEYLDEAGSDWVPALDETFDATYRTNQIGDGTDGNGPPLENYYVVSCGDLDLFVADIERPSAIGQAFADVNTFSPPWRFGPGQKAFFETAAAASTAVNRAFAIHKFPGGVRSASSALEWYGRGSGAHISKARLESTGIVFTAHERANVGSYTAGVGIPDELWMHDLLRAHGFRVCLTGHDHKWIHARKQTVNFIKGATGQSTLHFNAAADELDMFGNYRVDYLDRAADGVVAGRPGYGYMVYCVDPSGMSYYFRKTWVNCAQDADTKDNVGTQFRDLGPLLTGNNGAITLPETPRMILCVCSEAEGEWTVSTVPAIETAFGDTNRYTEPHAGDGASDFDEPYASGSIVYDDTGLPEGEQSIYVEYAPRSIGLNGTTTPIPLKGAMSLKKVHYYTENVS